MMDPDILVALIGLGGVIWTTTVALFFTHAKKQKAELSSRDQRIARIKQEANFEKQAINTFVNLQEWDTVSSRIQKFCSESDINRFLILVAVNGASSPRETTAIFQHRSDAGEFQSYVGVDLDNDYVSRLVELKNHGRLCVKTEDLPSSLIKDIYVTEGVEFAVWYLIGTLTNEETGQVAYKYCSFATDERSIDEETSRSINNIVGELKKLLGSTSYRAY